MKQLLTSIILTLILLGCEEKKEIGFQINGIAEQFNENHPIYLQFQNDISLETVDTAYVSKGKFYFEGTQTQPDLYFLSTEGSSGKLPVIIEKGAIKVTLIKDTIAKSTVGGTYNNVQLQKYSTSEIAQINIEKEIYQQRFNESLKKAQETRDIQKIKEIQQGYQDIVNRHSKAYNDYINYHPTSYISILLLADILYNPSSDITTLQNQFNNLSSDLKNSPKGIFIQNALNKMSAIDVGNKAPHFNAPTPEGQPLALKEAMGTITLIDFWASWCPPCRKESPYLVKINNDFKNKGLNIISISLDDNKQQWINAIKSDNLNWYHVSNLKRWSEPIAQLYKVKGLPTTFLIDENGTIIAKDLRQEDLYNKIEEIINSKK